jgi:hypothetical protein
MKLYELAYACRLYSGNSDFDTALNDFRRATAPRFDVRKPAHRKALLVWLNQWGCRQFSKQYHPIASRALRNWAAEYRRALPNEQARLARLSGKALAAAAGAYDALQAARAGMRSRGSKSWAVTFGPTGAAKVLYALRPEVFPPWDDPIRKHLGYDGSAASYGHFLLGVQAEVRNLEAEAKRLGIKVRDIPRAVGRRTSSLPKLVDEYYWITVSGGFTPPTFKELRQWVRWGSRAGNR